MQRECDGAVLAVTFAFAISAIEDIVDAFAVQRYEPEAVGDELIGQDGSVGFDLNKIDSHGRNLGEDSATEGVSKGKVHITKVKFDAIGSYLEREVSAEKTEAHEVCYISNCDSRPDVLESFHSLIIHDEDCAW